MSRVVSSSRLRLPYILGLALCGLLLAGLGSTAAGQELPACDDEHISDCRLPDWSEATERDIPSLFGEVEGIVWVEDERGDAPEGGLDILAAGAGRVTIDEPDSIRDSPALLKRGKVKQAVPQGEAILVRIVLDRAPDQAEGGHASVHLATDVDSSRSNNAPSGVAAPDFPLAGSQDVYSLTWAATTGKTRLFTSDLAKAWYKAKDPVAASWATPNVLDVLLAPSAIGEGFRVVTHAAGKSGGYDTLALGPAAIPTDGVVGLMPACIEGSIRAEPFVVRRLIENGQTVRDVEARASWRGGAAVPVDGAVRPALERFISEHEDDGDGRVGLRTWVNLFEDGLVIRQRPELQLALDGDLAWLSLQLGLTRRGYNVIRNLEAESTDDPDLDAWLERATDALRETMPPFRLGKKGGLLVGEAAGACIPWLAPEPATVREPPDDPASDRGIEVTADEAADGAANDA